MNTWRLHQAARALQRGGIIAYPTEAVYGLGCDPYNNQALARLLHLKQRDPAKGLILVAADYQQLSPFVAENLPAHTLEKMQASWPGPVTWLVPAAPWVSPLLRGNHSSIAIRVSNHPLVIALCNQLGYALTSTSANPQSHTPARTALRVHQYFGNKLDYVLAGSLGGRQQPSEIRDALSGDVIRTG